MDFLSDVVEDIIGDVLVPLFRYPWFWVVVVIGGGACLWWYLSTSDVPCSCKGLPDCECVEVRVPAK